MEGQRGSGTGMLAVVQIKSYMTLNRDISIASIGATAAAATAAAATAAGAALQKVWFYSVQGCVYVAMARVRLLEGLGTRLTGITNSTYLIKHATSEVHNLRYYYSFILPSLQLTATQSQGSVN